MREPAIPESPDGARRVFLGYVAAAIGTFIAALTGVPAFGYLAAPLKARRQAAWVPLGSAQLFQGDEPKVAAFTISRRDGWVEVQETRTCWTASNPDGSWLAFNGRCTHLGCAYAWRREGEHAGRFVCPCHDGVYDRGGRVLAGPPPRPLDRLETKVEGDQLWVLFQDFRPGVPAREPA